MKARGPPRKYHCWLVRPQVVIAAVVFLFLAAGGYLVFTRIAGGGGGGQADMISAIVTGSRMSPDSITVRQGDRVTLRITVDKRETIHLHGYDIKFEAGGAGDTVTRTFTADKTGSFEIEIEDTSTHLGSLAVTPQGFTGSGY